MQLKGTLSILHCNASTGGYISIRVVDDLSHARILEVKISYEEWGKAITGIASRPCQIDYNANGPFGLKRARKEELVPYSRSGGSGFMPGTREAKTAIAPYEVDGWQGSPEDYLNSKNSKRLDDGKDYRRVGFVRFVEPKGDDDD